MDDLKKVFHELVRFQIEIWNGVDARLRAELDLPLVHYEPMLIMSQQDPCRILEISTELVITTGGASKLVDRIEAVGLCERLPNPADRRSSLLRLTPDGRKLLAKAERVVDDELDRWLRSAVSDKALVQFGATLTRLRAAAHRVSIDQ